MSIYRRAAQAFIGASIAAIAATATPASAQRIDRIVAFGDSYADQGNLFGLGYDNPLARAVYPTGRFSGGTNYIDTLHQLLGAPVYNYAIGGAEGGVNNNTVCFSDPTYGGVACGRGLQYEVDQFLNGPTNGVFPTTSTTFTTSDLLALSIGGDDARFYQEAGGTLAAAPAAGVTAATVTSTNLTRLIANGTPTISFLAGDTGRLPEIANDPAGAAVRTAYSNSYNNAMQTTLAGYAANGSIVHYLDLNAILDNVTANPLAYGATNGIVCPLFETGNLTCLQSTQGYIIYGDGLHLTSGGFAIIARYVAAQLEGPLTLAAPSDMALDTARQFGRTLEFRSDVNGRTAAPGLHFFLSADGFSRSVGASQTNDPYDIDGIGATAGAEVGLGLGVGGIAINYTRPRLHFGNDAAKDKADSYQIGGYAGVGMGPLFAQGHLGYGSDKHHIDRFGVVDSMTASPKGHHVLAGAKGGYLMPMGVFQLGPVAGLDYAKATVNSYTENGDAALTLNVSKQTYEALTGNIGLEIRGAVAVPGAGVHPYAQALLEKDFTGDGRTIFFSQTSAPGIVNRFDYDERSQKIYGRLNAGISASVMGTVGIEGGLSATVGKKQGNDLSGVIGVRVGF